MSIETWRPAGTPVQQAATQYAIAQSKADHAKQLLIQACAEEPDTPISDLAEQAGVSRSTMTQWLKDVQGS